MLELLAGQKVTVGALAKAIRMAPAACSQHLNLMHAHGVLEAVQDAPWLRALVGRLTDHHEATRPTPWAVDDAPSDYVQQMLRAIVGIRIPLTRLVGKWKVSQNRSEADRLGVAEGLGADPMAGWVRRG